MIRFELLDFGSVNVRIFFWSFLIIDWVWRMKSISFLKSISCQVKANNSPIRIPVYKVKKMPK